MQRDEKDNEPNILDYLNEDCFHAVLDYLPVKDIISSERVCRQWQRMILEYLQHVRIGLQHPTEFKTYDNTLIRTQNNAAFKAYEKMSNLRWLEKYLHNWPSFELWTRKLGPSLVATYCTSEYGLEILKKYCPNLEAIMFSINLKTRWPHSVPDNENFKLLQWLHFSGCGYKLNVIEVRPLVLDFNNRLGIGCSVTDNFARQFISSDALEVVDIRGDRQMTGECFTNIKSTKLKSLVLQHCPSLEFRCLLSAVDSLSALTKLVLRHVSREIYWEIQLVLAKIRNLEHLDLYTADSEMRYMEVCESVTELNSLKHLGGNIVYSDFGLETVARSCKGLKSLEMESCYAVTGRGLEAMCRNVGRQLLALRIKSNYNVSDDDVVACIRNCPRLSLLNLDSCRLLTNELLARVAAARRELRPRPPALRVSIDCVALDLRANVENMETYEGLIIDY